MQVRAGLYARVSTRDQDCALQLDALRVLAQQRKWQANEYVDHGLSGASEKRPALMQLMKDAHRGKLDMVAVWKLDRFGRNLRHLVTTVEDLRTQGVDFFSLQDGFDTSTAGGRLVFNVVASFAEFEREVIGERTRAGIETARRRGKRIGRPKVIVMASRLEAVLEKGLPMNQVAKRLGISIPTLYRLQKRIKDSA